jgi:hypothetical protein
MTTKSWKVVIVGPTGAALTGAAFGLLYSFPMKEEAEAHAESLRILGIKLTLVEVERSNTEQLPYLPI